MGTAVALVVAFLTAPQPFKPVDAGVALARGAWIGWAIVPYIIGGLFFWQLAVRLENRMLLPSYETATSERNARASLRRVLSRRAVRRPVGHRVRGSGSSASVTLVRPLGVKLVSLLAFSLPASQTMILVSASGQRLDRRRGFRRVRMTPALISRLHSSLLVATINMAWLLPCSGAAL